jgi:putative ABC transport system permease protein
MLSWFSQIAAVTKFGILGIPQRRGAVAASVVGIACVVGVLVGVLSIAAGFSKAMNASISPTAAIVLRTGANDEMSSGLEREETRLISDAPGLARDTNGPLASPELFVIIDRPKRTTGTDANVPLRGVESAALRVRDNFKIVKGRPFEGGKNEVIVGVGAAQEFSDLDIGNKFMVRKSEWTVVGLFSTGGGVAESEVWADATVLQGAFHRGNSFQTIYAKLASPDSFFQFSNSLATDPRFKVKALRQSDYNAEHSTMLPKIIHGAGIPIVLLLAVGALFGALNTMYSSISARSREIATLRALGFARSAVVVAVMLESVVLAVVGGVFGAVFAYLAFNGFHTSTINWQSFSQVAFAFAVTPPLLVGGIILATLIGVVGGLFPAIRAARLPIAAALREL